MQSDHPIAYHSHKFTTAERNYSAGEQELLAVVLALTEFRCYVQGCAGGLTVDTDHSPNTFLPTVQMMPRKKARWAEFLSEFNFTWNHIPGRVNVADPLSRRPDFEQPASSAALLTERVHDDDPLLATHVHDLIRDAYQHDAWFQDPRHVQTFELRNGLFYGTEPADSRRNQPRVTQVVVPNSTPIKARILRDLHDSAIAGHPGVDRTYQSVRRWFWWRGMLRDIAEYVHSCHSCQTSKSSNQLPAGTLQPLPIPSQRWLSISMDFITGLPKRQQFDSILVVVDRFSKMVSLMPCKESITAKQTACLLFENVLCDHGLPESIVSDRDPRFTSSFWRSLAALYETNLCMGTAYHPQSDGQTERMNRLLEETLRISWMQGNQIGLGC
jgi:hypothetical protein